MTDSLVGSTELVACQDCDLLHTLPLPNDQQPERFFCTRCGAMLQDVRHDTFHHTLALSLTGLILALPANLLPIMEFSIGGLTTQNTMLNGVFKLFSSDYNWMAFLVLFCSVIAPLVNLLLLFSISLAVHWRALAGWLPWQLRLYHHLEEWGMLDVYMLGILVALIKIRDLGDLTISAGLYSFILLLIVTSFTVRSFDTEAVWRRLEAGK